MSSIFYFILFSLFSHIRSLEDFTSEKAREIFEKDFVRKYNQGEKYWKNNFIIFIYFFFVLSCILLLSIVINIYYYWYQYYFYSHLQHHCYFYLLYYSYYDCQLSNVIIIVQWNLTVWFELWSLISLSILQTHLSSYY